MAKSALVDTNRIYTQLKDPKNLRDSRKLAGQGSNPNGLLSSSEFRNTTEHLVEVIADRVIRDLTAKINDGKVLITKKGDKTVFRPAFDPSEDATVPVVLGHTAGHIAKIVPAREVPMVKCQSCPNMHAVSRGKKDCRKCARAKKKTPSGLPDTAAPTIGA